MNAEVYYEDYDENGIIRRGYFIENEWKGEIIRIEQKLRL